MKIKKETGTITAFGQELAFGQSDNTFELGRDDDGLSTASDYLKVSKNNFITTKNGRTLYKFIVRCYMNGCDRFLLHTDSKTTEDCILHMISRAKKVKAVKQMMENTMIVNTYSNSDTTRDAIKEAYINAAKDEIPCNLSFALTRLSSVTQTTNTGQLLTEKDNGRIDQLVFISSDSGPYAKQLWESYNGNGTDTIKMWFEDATMDMVNAFDGTTITLAPVTVSDYKKINSILSKSNFTGDVRIYECVRADLFPDIINSNQFSSVTSMASATVLNATGYDGLSATVNYESTCAALANLDWADLMDAGVLRPVCDE